DSPAFSSSCSMYHRTSLLRPLGASSARRSLITLRGILFLCFSRIASGSGLSGGESDSSSLKPRNFWGSTCLSSDHNNLTLGLLGYLLFRVPGTRSTWVRSQPPLSAPI